MEKVTFRGDGWRVTPPPPKREWAVVFDVDVLCEVVLERIDNGV